MTKFPHLLGTAALEYYTYVNYETCKYGRSVAANFSNLIQIGLDTILADQFELRRTVHDLY